MIKERFDAVAVSNCRTESLEGPAGGGHRAILLLRALVGVGSASARGPMYQ